MKAVELASILNKLSVHILLVNETSINPNCPIYLPIESFEPLTYEHKPGNGFKGGVIIYVHKSISKKTKPYHLKLDVPLAQACGIEIEGTKIISMYRSPSQEREDFEIWTEKLHKILKMENTVVIGDLNLHVDWFEMMEEEKYYRPALDAILISQSSQYVNKPTYLRAKNPRVLDVVLTKMNNIIHNTQVISDWEADGVDHLPVLTRMNLNCNTLQRAEIYSRKSKNIQTC